MGTPPFGSPVEQITDIELVLNFRIANTLGIEAPAALLNRADRTIP